jgi:lipopolysaccharide export LptBFGC system permease protein LptF
MKNSISLFIKLELLKGSVNAMMIPSKNGKRLIYGRDYRQQKKNVLEFLKLNYSNLENYFAKKPEFYSTNVHYIVFDNWLTKSSKFRKLKKKDVINFVKCVEDVVFSFLGIDDSSAISYNIKKCLIEPDESPAMLCVIELNTMDKSDLLFNSQQYPDICRSNHTLTRL